MGHSGIGSPHPGRRHRTVRCRIARSHPSCARRLAAHIEYRAGKLPGDRTAWLRAQWFPTWLAADRVDAGKHRDIEEKSFMDRKRLLRAASALGALAALALALGISSAWAYAPTGVHHVATVGGHA